MQVEIISSIWPPKSTKVDITDNVEKKKGEKKNPFGSLMFLNQDVEFLFMSM